MKIPDEHIGQKTYIGIDPGLSGAIGVVGPRVDVAPIKTISVGKGARRVLDVGGTKSRLSKIRDRGPCFCQIEKQQVMPKQGAVSGFTIGMNYGLILGILAALDIPTEIVGAKAWKKRMLADMPHDKGASIVRAKAIFPNVSLKPTPKSRKDSHDMAEALLLAEDGRRRRL